MKHLKLGKTRFYEWNNEFWPCKDLKFKLKNKSKANEQAIKLILKKT